MASVTAGEGGDVPRAITMTDEHRRLWNRIVARAQSDPHRRVKATLEGTQIGIEKIRGNQIVRTLGNAGLVSPTGGSGNDCYLTERGLEIGRVE